MGKAIKNDTGVIFAFYPKYSMSNRGEKRAIYFESSKLMQEIGEIEVEFLTDLFATERSYKELYAEIKSKYLDILKTRKFKHIIPNKDYIEKKYAPV